MDPAFWHQRWQDRDLGFHQPAAHPALAAHLGALALPEGSRVGVPLCGKTRDIAWLRDHGYRVAGVELVEQAVEELFDELGESPTIERAGPVRRYSVRAIDVFVGSIFDVSAAVLGPVDALWDRAALVALPKATRRRYAAHLLAITQAAPQLLVTFVYDPACMDGPPFSVDDDEVRRLYGDAYAASRIARTEVAGGLKGRCPATENVWLLRG